MNLLKYTDKWHVSLLGERHLCTLFVECWRRCLLVRVILWVKVVIYTVCSFQRSTVHCSISLGCAVSDKVFCSSAERKIWIDNIGLSNVGKWECLSTTLSYRLRLPWQYIHLSHFNIMSHYSELINHRLSRETKLSPHPFTVGNDYRLSLMNNNQ